MLKLETQASCPSCGSQDLDDWLKPYCSIICRQLGLFGLGWRTNPYHIIDLETGAVLAAGPHLDLSSKAVSKLVIMAKSLRRRYRRLCQLQKVA